MEDMSVWMVLLDQLVVPIVFLIVTPIVVALVNRLWMLIEEKWGIEIKNERMNQIDKIVLESLDYAEEQARKRLRGEESDMTGEEKLEAAVKYAKDRGRQVGLNELTEDFAEVIAERVESMLFEKRRLSKDREDNFI